MTFEEFFSKKKIDLNLFEQGDPQLYAEFKGHFSEMGPKSFDHSKKFWFNKLRRLYHLKEQPKEKITQVETAIASQAEPLSSPTMEQKPAGFTPRFRKAAAPPAATAKEATAAPKEESPAPAAAPAAEARPAKVGFRPHNIPAKPAEEGTAANAASPAHDTKSLDSRPGTTEVSDTPIVSAADKATEAPKPAYKPKFKPRNIPKNPSGAAEQTGSTTEQKQIPETAETTATTPAKQDDETPKASSAQALADKAGADTPAAASETSPEAEAPQPAKPAYKPRFNMKNIKPKE